MIKNLDSILTEQSDGRLYALCAAIVFVLGLLDYLTGFELSFFIFYAVPIWIATWYIGKTQGLFFAGISILSWALADYYTGYNYNFAFTPYWNGTIRLIFFIFTAMALSDMKAKLLLEEQNADFDSLTGILNGRGFRERAGVILPLMRREEQPYALVFIDVDNFKAVNDTKGHAEGDLILKKVAGIMQSSLRASDITGRLGGDEFVALLPRTNLEQAEKAVTQLKSDLDKAAKASGWPIGFSTGAGIFNSEMTDIDQSIKLADTLMYEVKKSGKGRLECREISA